MIALWIILGLLALILVLMLIPAGLALHYHGEDFTAEGKWLFLRFTLWPLPEKEEPEKAEKKQACREKIPSAVAKRAKRHPHTLLNPDLRFGFFQNGLQLSECIDTDTKSISIFTRF